MPEQNPTRGTVGFVASAIGRSQTAIRKYIAKTWNEPDVLGMDRTGIAITLDVEKTRAYADSRPKGRPSKQTEAGA